MNIEKLKKIYEKINVDNPIYLTTKDVKDLIIEQKAMNKEITINEYFDIFIDGFSICLDFEKQRHLLLPF